MTIIDGLPMEDLIEWEVTLSELMNGLFDALCDAHMAGVFVESMVEVTGLDAGFISEAIMDLYDHGHGG